MTAKAIIAAASSTSDNEDPRAISVSGGGASAGSPGGEPACNEVAGEPPTIAGLPQPPSSPRPFMKSRGRR